MRELDRLPELPTNWIWTKLKDIGTIYSGRTPSTADESNFSGGIPWITPADLSGFTGKYIYGGKRSLSEKGLSNSSAVFMPKGTVLFSSRAPIGYVAIAGCPMATNQGFKNIVPANGVLSEFVYYYLSASKKLAEEYASGTTFKEISATAFSELPFPLPPSSEQHRIVAKIEEIFSRLDAGVEALRKVQDLLKLYRTSVREAAVRGRLVPIDAEIAGGNRQSVESTDKSSERNEDNSIRQFNTCSADSCDLPSGWKWATVAQLASHEANAITDGPFGSNLKTSHYTSSGPRVIRLQNIGDGTFIDERAHISQEHYERLKKYAVKPGDIIIALLGERLPRSCVLPNGIGPAIVKADCVRFAPNRSIALPKFLNYALNSETVRKRIALIVHGVGRPRLNLKEVKSILLPLPPLAEQARIVAEADRIFSVVDLLNTVIEQTLRNANALRNSILRLAFTGQLVPQDPTDEPASKLLERIRAERARMEADQPRKRKRRAN